MLKDTVKILSIAKLETHRERQTFYLQAPFYCPVRWDHINLCPFQRWKMESCPSTPTPLNVSLSDLLKSPNARVTLKRSFHRLAPSRMERWTQVPHTREVAPFPFPSLILMFTALFIINQFIDLWLIFAQGLCWFLNTCNFLVSSLSLRIRLDRAAL